VNDCVKLSEFIQNGLRIRHNFHQRSGMRDFDDILNGLFISTEL
jgi:hypothetical protein